MFHLLSTSCARAVPRTCRCHVGSTHISQSLTCQQEFPAVIVRDVIACVCLFVVVALNQSTRIRTPAHGRALLFSLFLCLLSLAHAQNA